MSRSPRGDAVRVGGGRLRVDAARAVTKLREYQLPDPTLWTLEVVRAAVLLGAEALYVEADADDVWIGWEGPPLAREDLTALFDDLVSSSDQERRGQRLLAIGVNTALALEPRFVDVYGIDGAGAQRVRYTPRLLIASADGHSQGLRSLLAETLPRPDWVLAIAKGNAVHVRRALSFETMTRAVRMDVPPEVHRVLAAANALAIPIHARPRPAPPPPPLLRVPFGDGTAHPHLRGHAEIVAVEHASIHARLVWSELGVVLTGEALALGMAAEGRRMPITVQIDRDRLPTNAARSALRDDEPAIEDARRDAIAAGKSLAPSLAEAIEAALARGDHGRHHALRAAAIAIVHAQDRSNDGWQVFVRKAARDAWFAPLLEVPVARDILGAQRTLRELADANSDVVHRGDAPVRDELAPYLRGIPWAPPGDPLLRLYGDRVPKDAGHAIAAAARRAAARIRFLATDPIELTPTMQAGDLAACDLPIDVEGESWVPEGRLTSLRGRVIVRAVDPSPSHFPLADERRYHAEVVVLVDDRALHRSRIPCELPLTIRIGGDSLRPNPEYTGLTDHDALDRAIDAALWAAVRATERVAATMFGDTSPRSDRTLGPALKKAERPVLHATVRAAQRLAIRLSAAGQSSKKRDDALRALVVKPGPLRDAPVFSTWDGQAHSLASLQALAHERGVLGTASRAPTRSLGDRVILALHGPDARALSDLLCARVGDPPPRRSKKARPAQDAHVWPLQPAIVSYGDELAIGSTTTSSALSRAFAGARAVLAHDGEDFRAAVALLPEGETSRVHLYHAGRRLTARHPLPDAHVPLALAIDDDALVPTAGFEDLFPGQSLAGPKYDAVVWTERLARALADHLLGPSPEKLTVHEHDRARLLVTLAELLPDAPTPRDGLADVRARLRALPIVPSVGGFRVPLERLLLAGASALPFVHPDTADRVGAIANFEAAVLSLREAMALSRFFGVALDDRSAIAHQRYLAERRTRAEAAFLDGPERPLAMPEGAVTVSGSEITRGFARPAERHAARLVVTSRGRRVTEHPSADAERALEVHVDVDLSLVDLDAMDLTPEGQSRVRGASKDAARRLLTKMIADDPARIGQDAAWSSLAHAFVDGLPKKRSATRQALLDALLAAPFVPSLSGDRVSIAEALRQPERVVFHAREFEGWLGPSVGQKPHALDRAPILALPAEDADTELQKLISSLAASVGKLRDVTKEARRLRDARQVARGGGGEARLPPHVDRRFVVSLKTIAQRSQASDTLLEVFPQGEAALVDAGATRLLLLDARGEEARSYTFVPPVLIVARSPYSGELDEPEAAKTVERATRTVVAEVLRWTIDTVPPSAWTPAMRKAIRGAALLGGRTHLERISSAAIFPTAKGAHLSYDELRAQVNRFGPLWTVLEPTTLEPLDTQREVLVLAEHERAQLHPLLPTTDGFTELSLDAKARRNMERPKVSAVAPSAELRASALGCNEEALAPGTLWALPLAPHDAQQPRGLMTYRDRAPLGLVKDPCRWPTLTLADAPELKPDRVHGAPIDDDALRAVEDAARRASEAALMARFIVPEREGTYPFLVDDDVSRAVFLGRGVEVRGRLTWSGLADPDRARVRVEDVVGLREASLRATAPKALIAVPVPIGGELVVSGASFGELPGTQLDGLARRAYIAMLLRAAAVWRDGKADEDARALALAMLVQGAIGFGSGGLTGKWQTVSLDFLAGSASDLRSLAQATRAAAPVFSLAPSEREVIGELPKDALVLLRDESLPSQVAHAMLGHRIQSLREWLDRDRAPAPEPSTPRAPSATARASKSASKPPAPPPTIEPVPERAHEVLTRRVGALARQVSANLPPLRFRGGRAMALMLGDDRVVSSDPILHRVADAPSSWPNVAPLLAAEVLRTAQARDETDAIVALLNTLPTST